MPCTSRLSPEQTLAQRMEQVRRALQRLEMSLQNGQVKLVIASNGAVAFANWNDRDDITDACAFRTLSAQNSWALRQARQRAEALSGRKVNENAVMAGFHSHDNGNTWNKH